jgi:hypothetical protein
MVEPDTGVIRITGTGLGPDLVVIVDGQAVTALPGATASQIEVLAPSTVVTSPGTYRLTVMDPVRQVGDAFVVASHTSSAAAGSTLQTVAATAERPTPQCGRQPVRRGRQRRQARPQPWRGPRAVRRRTR